MAADRLVYIGQKAVVNKNGEVLVLTAPNIPLDFPGGKIQEDELDAIESLNREVKEETGLVIAVGQPFTTSLSEFPLTNGEKKTIFFVFYTCTYVYGIVKLSHEHTQYMWVNKANYQALKQDTLWYTVLDQYFTQT